MKNRFFSELQDHKEANKLIETVWSMENQEVSTLNLDNEADNLIDIEPGVEETQALSRTSALKFDYQP